MPESEVARMRRAIDTANEAAERGLSALACVASHEVILRKMEQISQTFQQQLQEVGEEQAFEHACIAMNALHEEVFVVAKTAHVQQEDSK